MTRPAALALLLVSVVLGLAGAVLTAFPAPAHATEVPPAEQQLADRFAPVVVVRDQDVACGPGEPFRPVAVEAVLGQPDVVLRGPDGGVVTTAPTAADVAGKPQGYYLDLPGDPLEPDCDYEKWFQRAGGDLPNSVYARVVSDPSHPDTIAVQYWFFWVFNEWNDLHEGDWEMVQLLFPARTAEEALGTTPSTVAFAQHEGSEVAEWDSPKVLRDGDHVAVYPGQGSHAAYFTQSRWFGKSAAAGFGCDHTGIDDGQSARLLRPETPLLTDEAWLTFQGRWGEKELSFNNGPTGPSQKRQWAEPVAWQLEEGRPEAVAIPATAGAAVDAFCSVAAGASLLFVEVLDHPVVVGVLLVAAVLLLVWLARATRWRGSPADVASRRRAGQILVAPLGLLGRGWRWYLPVGLCVAAGSLASLWLQGLLLRPHPTSLMTVGPTPDGVLDWVGLAVVGLLAGAGAFFAVAVAQVLTRDLPDCSLPVALTGNPTRRSWWRLVVAYLLVVLCAATLIGLPLALYLVARWSVASPAAAVADLRLGAAGRESARLVRSHRIRAVLLTLAIGVLGTWTGAALGAVVVLLVPVPFWVANGVALAVFATGLCWAGVAFVLHYWDLRLRAGEPAPAGSSDNLPR